MAAWVFSLLVLLAPPARLAALHAFPGFAETAEQRTERYSAIATAIADATKDPREMALLVAVSFHESAWARDTDVGPACYRGPRGDGPRCDFGKAVSVYQIQAIDADDARTLFADRGLATRRALAAVRRSGRACVPKYGAEAGLRAYAGGSCQRGIKESEDMVRLARKLLGEHPPPKVEP